jgi:NAD(P)-dependent dehydrogenase (short-subunit alcohol dehydrogenase family)
MRLKENVAIVTGGAHGMGEAEARLFAAEGAKVVVADILEHEAEIVAADIRESRKYARSMNSRLGMLPDGKSHSTTFIRAIAAVAHQAVRLFGDK